MARTYLTILGERKALAWVLSSENMALAERHAKLAEGVRAGDRLLLYSSRGCFHNPVKDRGRVFGEAVVADRPQRATVEVAGAKFSFLMSIRLEALSPFRGGLELSPLVLALEVFPDVKSWSARMRTALLPLPQRDASFIRERLAPLLQPPDVVRHEYLQRAIGAREKVDGHSSGPADASPAS